MKAFTSIVLALCFSVVQAKRPHSFLIPNSEIVEKAASTSRRSRTGMKLPDEDEPDDEVKSVSSSILHSVEVAEKAFVDAVRNEVDVLFHDKDHEHHVSMEKAKEVKPVSTKTVIKKHDGKTEELDDLNMFTINHYPYAWGLH